MIWLKRLPYSALPLLYSSASALIFPSLFEGGGIPVIEAMACGCPVVSSSIDVVKEFTGDAAYYFNGKSTKEISSAMLKLQGDKKVRDELIFKGIERAKFFSGKEVVKKLLVAYKGVVS